MSTSGYTLFEMLVALAILGLAVAGLSSGLQVLTRWQTATNDVAVDLQGLRQAQARLDRGLERAGPFRSDKPEFTGAATGFHYDCGGTQDCQVVLAGAADRGSLQFVDGDGRASRLPLPRHLHARFVYDSGRDQLATWPPAGARRTLRAISLLEAETDAPLLSTRLWREEPQVCDFDVVSQDCRQ